MAGLGEVLIDNQMAMFRVEATEGGIDRDRELSPGNTGKAPQKRDREELLFTRREALDGEGLTVSVVEVEPEGGAIDHDPVYQAGFVEQQQKVLRDGLLQFA